LIAPRTPSKDLSLEEGYLLIGRFITLFSDLDVRLSEFVAQFFRLNIKHDWADTIVHSMDVGRRCEIIKAFCHGLDSFKDIKKTVEKIEKISTARNIAAHGRLARNPQGELYLRLHGAAKFLRSSPHVGTMLVTECLDQIESIETCKSLLNTHSKEMSALFSLVESQGHSS